MDVVVFFVGVVFGVFGGCLVGDVGWRVVMDLGGYGGLFVVGCCVGILVVVCLGVVIVCGGFVVFEWVFEWLNFFVVCLF